MAKRNSKSQSKHDFKVRQTAKKLERQGWDVDADIPGFQQPDPIGKFRPDIRARKRGAERIIEVETPETMEKDEKQHQAFRRSAAQKKRTTFKIEKA